MAALGFAIVATGLLTATCDDAFFPADGLLPLGTWGGDNAGVIATDSLTHVHVACTFGDVEGRIQLDADGRFTSEGSYVLQAYPVAVGPPMPAQFTGRLTGRVLTMSVSVNDTIANTTVTLGPIVVTYERTPDMAMCPICDMPGQ